MNNDDIILRDAKFTRFPDLDSEAAEALARFVKLERQCGRVVRRAKRDDDGWRASYEHVHAQKRAAWRRYERLTGGAGGVVTVTPPVFSSSQYIN